MLEETHEEWLVLRRYFSQESLALLKTEGAPSSLALGAASRALAT